MPIVTYAKKSGKGKKFNSWRIHYGKYAKQDLKGGHFINQPTQSFLIVGGQANDIPEKVWNQLKEIQDVKDRLESGELTVLKLPSSKDAKGKANGERKEIKSLNEIENLLQYSTSEAILIIENTMESQTLIPWLNAEKDNDKPRHSVLKSLERQIKGVQDADAHLNVNK
jgi:hypothetical protein